MPENRSVPIIKADAVVDVGAVVVECQHAAITLTTMLCSQRLHSSARVTQSTKWVRHALLTPVLKPSNLHTNAFKVNAQLYSP